MQIQLTSVFLCLLSFSANANVLYKCTGPKKDAVSIQSTPCPAGTKQIWVRDGTPEPLPTDAQLRAREAKRLKDAESARILSQMAGTDSRSQRVAYRNTTNANPAKQKCDSAKREAKRIRDRDWRIMNVERLRQLDLWVEAQCNQ